MFFFAFLLKLKAAFLAVLQFCLDNWKIVLPIVILVFCLFKYNQQVNRANDLAKKYQAAKQETQSMAESLQNAAFLIQKQNLSINEANKRAEKAQLAAQNALKLAKQANIINNNKKQAITAKINIEKPDTCETAIDEVKALLK